jgi:hypothetical protein
MLYAASCRLARPPGVQDELIIRAEANQVTCNHVLECLELGLIRDSSGQVDAAHPRSKITCSEVDSSLPPSSVSLVLTLFPKWLTSCLM